MKALLLAGLGLAALACTDAALAADPGFDKPIKQARQPLTGAAAKNPKTGTFCFYFTGFMVKQVDEGEEGAEQLSIVPAGDPAKLPACQRQNLPDEKIVAPEEWSGYFKGVKGDYVLFDADDGVNGALGFAVFAAATAKKLFEDAAFDGLQQVSLDAGTLKLRYQRSFSGDCSVPKSGAGCWTSLAKAAGLDAAKAPDCAAGYLADKTALAKGRCEADGKPGAKPDAKCLAKELKAADDQHFDESPSVLVYPVETAVSQVAQGFAEQPGPVSCHAAD
jgi:hypothetical protein